MVAKRVSVAFRCLEKHKLKRRVFSYATIRGAATAVPIVSPHCPQNQVKRPFLCLLRPIPPYLNPLRLNKSPLGGGIMSPLL